MPHELKFTWNGPAVEKRFKRAVGRGTIGIATRVGTSAQGFVHVITGTLRRSIHAAKSGSGGLVEPTVGNVVEGFDAVVEVGSWIEYACVEEVGLGHRYMQPGLDAARPMAVTTMQAAFKQEGFD